MDLCKGAGQRWSLPNRVIDLVRRDGVQRFFTMAPLSQVFQGHVQGHVLPADAAVGFHFLHQKGPLREFYTRAVMKTCLDRLLGICR